MFSLVERSTGRKLKTLHTDNGAEYVSADFKNCSKKEGVLHELTILKTLEQNGVAERMNRTLVEALQSMLADARHCLQPCTYEIGIRQLQWKERHLLKPGQNRNQMWDTLEFSDVLGMLM